MKLKYIVAALGLVASASSFAAILVPNTPGGGELFLVVYEQNAPNGGLDQSFTLDLGITTSQFIASNTTAQTWATLDASTNSDWSSFLSTSDLGSLQFAVMGSQVTSSSATQNGASTVFSTVTIGKEGSVVGAAAAAQTSNGQLSTMIDGTLTTGYTSYVTNTGTHLTQDNGQSVNAIGTNAYFQQTNMAAFNSQLKFTNNNAVGSAPVEFTSLYRNSIQAGSAKALQYVEPLMVSFVQTGSQYVLNYGSSAVAAVPEASGFAMALAGFGLLGFASVRRKQK